MERYPVAYLRRSSADSDNPGDVSREAQEQAVRELAHRDGHNGNLRVFVDWDRSADEAKEGKRAGFAAMLAAIEAGEVSAVYSYALDRLYRSLRTFVRLTDAGRAHDVRIVTLREGVLGGDGSPMAMAFSELTAVFNTLELRTAKARAAGALAVRRSRGDHIGRAGYGTKLGRNESGAIVLVPDPSRPLEPVLAAVREAGSILGACKLLDARGVPVPQGPAGTRRHTLTHWYPTPLRKIVERNAPELLPPSGPAGRRTPTHSLLAQLLVCHCGHVLTPEPARKAYRCTVGNRTGREAHGLMYVSEREIMPWIREEAARLRVPGDVAEVAKRNAGRADAVRERLARYAEMYGEGSIKRERFDAEKTRATKDLAALSTQAAMMIVPQEIDWSWPTERIGTVLRSIWSCVRLDSTMRPVAAEWTVPEWRA